MFLLLLACATQPINNQDWYCYDNVAYKMTVDNNLLVCDNPPYILYHCTGGPVKYNCEDTEVTINCNDTSCTISHGLISIDAQVCSCTYL